MADTHTHTLWMADTLTPQEQRAQQQAQQQQAMLDPQLQTFQATLTPQEQNVVMQYSLAQRPQAIVQLVQRKRRMQQQG
jgi:hypothetical protein